AAGWWWGRGVTVPPPPQMQTAPSLPDVGSSAAGTIVVHVAGWVAAPGLVEIPAAGRVGDALAAAGGALPGAALDSLNLARQLGDGEQVVVPGIPTSLPTPDLPGATGEPASDGRIHLNSASASDLESLPGVGPVLAERIV